MWVIVKYAGKRHMMNATLDKMKVFLLEETCLPSHNLFLGVFFDTIFLSHRTSLACACLMAMYWPGRSDAV